MSNASVATSNRKETEPTPRAFKASNGRKKHYRCATRLPGGGRKWVWCKAKREAENKAIEEERLRGPGLDANAKTEALASFMGRFLDFVKPNDDNEYGVSPFIHQDYNDHSEIHIVPALGSDWVRQITVRDVYQFLKSKSDSGLAVATVKYIHRVLRRALSFAVDWNVIERNPASARMRTAARRKPVSAKGTPLDISNVLHHFQKVCADAELPKLRYYDLRHTHASLLIANGLHPKLSAERLAHSSIKLTLDTYGHLFEGSDPETAKKMDQLFGTKTPTKPAGHKVVQIRKKAI